MSSSYTTMKIISKRKEPFLEKKEFKALIMSHVPVQIFTPFSWIRWTQFLRKELNCLSYVILSCAYGWLGSYIHDKILKDYISLDRWSYQLSFSKYLIEDVEISYQICNMSNWIYQSGMIIKYLMIRIFIWMYFLYLKNRIMLNHHQSLLRWLLW